MPKQLQARLDRLKYKLHEAQPKLHENLLLRKRMVERAYSEQLRNERDDISSRMRHLQPGPKQLFLKLRLEKIKKQLTK